MPFGINKRIETKQFRFKSTLSIVASCFGLVYLVEVGAWLSTPTFRPSCPNQLGVANGVVSRSVRYPFLFRSSKDSEVDILRGPWNASSFGATGCWGTHPLLLVGGFSDSQIVANKLPTWQDILSLVCSEDEDILESITCRVIRHRPRTLDTFTVDFGPFPDERQLQDQLMQNDDSTASTLVVNDVDRWIPDLSDWMDKEFDFLPRWRRDDAQISLAAKGGGIGPHVDNYDVFLIQTSGSREWEVGLDQISVEQEFDSLVEASEVRILDLTNRPVSTVKLELKAGDCLYLPPRFVHCGKSTSNDCVTLSVGCRAPSAADLMSGMAESIATSTAIAAVQRYSERAFPIENSTKSLSSTIKSKMKDLVLNLVQDLVDDEQSWDEFVGRLVTKPNRPGFNYPTPLTGMDKAWKQELGVWGDSQRILEALLSGKGVLRRAEGVSFAWSVLHEEYRPVGNLYAQGNHFQLRGVPLRLLELLLNQITDGPPMTASWLNQEGIISTELISMNMEDFLVELLETGMLYGDYE